MKPVSFLSGLYLDSFPFNALPLCEETVPEETAADIIRRYLELTLTEMTAPPCGGNQVTNVLGLSSLCALTNLVTRRALREAIRTSVRAPFLEQNLKAMELGYRMARELRNGMGEREKETLPNFGYLREKPKAAGPRPGRRSRQG